MMGMGILKNQRFDVNVLSPKFFRFIEKIHGYRHNVKAPYPVKPFMLT